MKKSVGMGGEKKEGARRERKMKMRKRSMRIVHR